MSDSTMTLFITSLVGLSNISTFNSYLGTPSNNSSIQSCLEYLLA